MKKNKNQEKKSHLDAWLIWRHDSEMKNARRIGAHGRSPVERRHEFRKRLKETRGDSWSHERTAGLNHGQHVDARCVTSASIWIVSSIIISGISDISTPAVTVEIGCAAGRDGERAHSGHPVRLDWRQFRAGTSRGPHDGIPIFTITSSPRRFPRHWLKTYTRNYVTRRRN